jgi:hypothetical protein
MTDHYHPDYKKDWQFYTEDEWKDYIKKYIKEHKLDE